ncbi:hypothetical protein B0H10DRAFT_1937710 [Mycena sp. CBHHK59/15]|nr:hypothetical protein B0H10DRAFT_1937710 [Mycena sp. CBHHK59/15]
MTSPSNKDSAYEKPSSFKIGANIEYKLIARVIYIGGAKPGTIGHFITKIRLKDTTYLYNNLQQGGELTKLGLLYLLEVYNANTTFVLYLCQLITTTTSRTVEEIHADFEKLPSPPGPEKAFSVQDSDSSGSLREDPMDEDNKISQMLMDTLDSPKKDIPMVQYSSSLSLPPKGLEDDLYTPAKHPAEMNSNTPWPLCAYLLLSTGTTPMSAIYTTDANLDQILPLSSNEIIMLPYELARDWKAATSSGIPQDL